MLAVRAVAFGSDWCSQERAGTAALRLARQVDAGGDDQEAKGITYNKSQTEQRIINQLSLLFSFSPRSSLEMS